MFKKIGEFLFGPKINNTRVVPVTLKIIIMFLLFILFSNLATNYINLSFNRGEMIALEKKLMAKDLREIYDFANNQYEIYQFNDDLQASLDAIEQKALSTFDKEKSVVLGISPDDASFLLEASKLDQKYGTMEDMESWEIINSDTLGVSEGFIHMDYNDEEYIAVYKYNTKWSMYIVRGEELDEFLAISRKIFTQVSIVIIILTLVLSIVGTFLMRYILRYVHKFTSSIVRMINNQQMDHIDLEGATNDDITFLGASFNSLSSTIDNLVTIFRKFATRDVAEKAYRDKEIRLEGTQKDLTILFSDIKGFTFITETLGSDIIKLLNMHYDKAIRSILDHEGIIGSIIGDALLAVFGTRGGRTNKSYLAITAGYKLQEVASFIRKEMTRVKEDLIQKKGALTKEEEVVYKAVMLEIGVGVDGGDVFYGNIGSYERMTNTVIGDNVNSASRLEGLTRIYKVPVIVSEYVKKDIETNVENHGYTFVELDKVQVKGKTIGKKVYWPISQENMDDDMQKRVDAFHDGLELYYKGSWPKANKIFKECGLPQCEVFIKRTEGVCPPDWKGIWAMKTK